MSDKRFTENPEKKIPATIEWVSAFHDQAKSDELPNLGALCMFMFDTAARVGEACRLTWRGVDLGHAVAELHLLKPTQWSRIAHLPPEAVAALATIPSNRKPDELVFGYSGRGSVRGPWNNVCERADIERLTPFVAATGSLHRFCTLGSIPRPWPSAGGWKDATSVLRTYAHAMKDRNVINALFGTNLAQGVIKDDVRAGKEKGKFQ